jgi:acetyltransferase-like isoleucine patch superfamily enzyme
MTQEISTPDGLRSNPIVAAPGETERRSLPRWLARGVLVLCGLPKSVLFNLRYLPLRQALRLPILVSHRVALFNLGGSVQVDGPLRPGMILLGFGANGAFDFRRSRSGWQVAGQVVFGGPARLGNGFKLSVATGGEVRFGPDFVLSAESQIVSRDAISFGRSCLVSWEVLIIDADFHPVVDADGTAGPRQAPITLGDRVWVGARSTVLKGVALGNDVVVAAGSVVPRADGEDGVVLAGNPARVVRTGVRWSH